MQKKEGMGVKSENWQNQQGIIDINNRNDPEIRDTRGLFIPVIENETILRMFPGELCLETNKMNAGVM